MFARNYWHGGQLGKSLDRHFELHSENISNFNFKRAKGKESPKFLAQYRTEELGTPHICRWANILINWGGVIQFVMRACCAGQVLRFGKAPRSLHILALFLFVGQALV